MKLGNYGVKSARYRKSGQTYYRKGLLENCNIINFTYLIYMIFLSLEFYVIIDNKLFLFTSLIGVALTCYLILFRILVKTL